MKIYVEIVTEMPKSKYWNKWKKNLFQGWALFELYILFYS